MGPAWDLRGTCVGPAWGPVLGLFGKFCVFGVLLLKTRKASKKCKLGAERPIHYEIPKNLQTQSLFLPSLAFATWSHNLRPERKKTVFGRLAGVLVRFGGFRALQRPGCCFAKAQALRALQRPGVSWIPWLRIRAQGPRASALPGILAQGPQGPC